MSRALRSSSLGSLARIDSVSSSGVPSSPTITTLLSKGGEVLFESYLQKTPPLDRLFVVSEHISRKLVTRKATPAVRKGLT